MEREGTDELERDAIDHERRLLAELVAGSAARAAALRHASEFEASERKRNELAHTERMAEIAAERERRTSEAIATRDRVVAETEATFASEMMRLARKREMAVAQARAKAEEARQAAQRAHDEAIWLAESVYEGAEGKPRADYEKLREEITTQKAELEAVEQQAAVLVRRYRQRVPSRAGADEALRSEAAANPPLTMTTSTAIVRSQLAELRGLKIPGLFRGPILLVPWMLVTGASLVAAGLLSSWSDALLLAATAVGVTLLLAAVVVALWFAARRQVLNAWAPLSRAVSAFAAAAEAEIERAAGERADKERQLVATRDEETAKARAALAPRLSEVSSIEVQALTQIEEQIPGRRRKISETREHAVSTAKKRAEEELAKAVADHDSQKSAELARVAARRAEIAASVERSRADAVRAWRELQQRSLETVRALERADHARSPRWDDDRWKRWEPPRTFAPAARIGSIAIDLASIPEALPKEPELAWPLDGASSRFLLPVTLSLPDRSSLLVECGPEARDQAIGTLQAAMMRLLTGLPPGKAHLVVLDPVGLGQSFAGFMHLADASAKLVGDRIWTESRHIEQRLSDLTEHMETVIQKYLRDEFPTIQHYNEQAGELAEPYRFLVVADYPANFSEVAANRLNSIVGSGARCGVFTLILRDVRRELPPTADLALLRRDPVRIEWRKDRLVLAEAELDALPIELDPAPPAELVIGTMRTVGEAAVDAGRVEVPFAVIAPKTEKLWSESSAGILRVPLGRTGATKLQSLVLGEGTKQHVLIAGKTGSGKSTLLHALITNTALWYGPDEVEMFLVDFKKGVEFKTYAEHSLPHARAIAIESDREFGLSVLQGLDGELKRRGDLYRELGVQDLKGFRAARPKEPMPRVLLIVDEFQELFIEDDKVAQDASLLLDRLVRQGRAFGMHVILGSQTLGGAYSLPRTTMGQMAVRIALQCNEADAQLILSDDNTAARLLGRPGEAIYNDAGGLVQGNSPFQIVWLSDKIRDEWLERCTKAIAAAPKRRTTTAPPIVFEGNVPADIADNPLLADALAAKSWPAASASVAAPRAWLGEPISIKEPSAALFRRQNGANVVAVGQQDDAAAAVMSAALISLAAQCSPERSKIVLLDGLPADDPFAGSLARIAKRLPHSVDAPAYREADDAIRRVAEEVGARTSATGAEPPPTFLLIHALHRFRSLRREEDYGFSSGDAPATPAALFAAILRDGPAVGVHVITWVDTLASLHRVVDRASLREFDQRVLFQLSATDSSTLIDSPAATRLGANRALLYSEEQGTLEKFRPYRMPSDEWLTAFERTLRARVGKPAAAPKR
ncbi:MAG: cell division protein FtsK [Phycisphaerae bacterium]|nr:cell division protein FtsK [Phycisphaerae bacterium]